MTTLDADVEWVRQGTGYFAGRLAALSDADLDAPSLLPGWDRRHVVAHVGFNARGLGRLVGWARTGVETPMYASPQARDDEIDAGARLAPQALRELFAREARALAAAWADLPADRWGFPIRTRQGRMIPVSSTPWMRAREVWLHAVDLDDGGRFEDFPSPLVDRLLTDITSWWAANGEGVDLALVPTDRAVPGLPAAGGPGAATIQGTVAQLTRWASGRGADGLVTGSSVAPPRWL